MNLPKRLLWGCFLGAAFCFSCNSGDGGTTPIGTDSTAAAARPDSLPPSVCYQLGVEGLDEYWSLQIQGTTLKGQGRRYIHQLGMLVNLTVGGTIDASRQAKVTVTAVKEQDSNAAESQYELWRIEKEALIIIDRKVEGLAEQYQFFEVNCAGNRQKNQALFDEISGFYNGYSIAKREGKRMIINEQKEVLCLIPDDYSPQGIINEESLVFYNKANGRFGMMDIHGAILLEPIYDKLHCYNEGLAAFLGEDSKGLWGFLDRKGKVAIRPQYNTMIILDDMPARHPFSEGLAPVGMDGKWGYIDTKGKMVIPMKFGHANPFKNGEAKVYSEQGTWIFIDKTGKCVRDCN